MGSDPAERDLRSIRNIGIIAHIDAGKTTTTERDPLLHRRDPPDGGCRQGEHDHRLSRRGAASAGSRSSRRRSRASWKDADGRPLSINLIDTPGHVDFTAEVERSLRVLDGAVVVFSAVEGVEAQSETVWRQAAKYRVPRICFINKMDRIGSEFERVYQRDRRTAARQPPDSGADPDRGGAGRNDGRVQGPDRSDRDEGALLQDRGHGLDDHRDRDSRRSAAGRRALAREDAQQPGRQGRGVHRGVHGPPGRGGAACRARSLRRCGG